MIQCTTAPKLTRMLAQLQIVGDWKEIHKRERNPS